MQFPSRRRDFKKYVLLHDIVCDLRVNTSVCFINEFLHVPVCNEVCLIFVIILFSKGDVCFFCLENKAIGVMKAGHAFTIEPMISEGRYYR